MLLHPRLRRSFTANVVDGTTLFLLSERKHLMFEGEAYVALAPLLDGRPLGDVLAGAGAKVELPSLFSALAQLERKGALMEGACLSEDGGRSAFWDDLGVQAGTVRQALANGSVAVQGAGSLPLDTMREALTAAGLLVSDDGALRLHVVEDYLNPELATVNQAALVDGRPWALVKPVGSIVWVGPIFHPGQSACWECLAQRLRINRQVDRYVSRRTKEPPPTYSARSWLASSVSLAFHWAASELARSLVVDEGRGLQGLILTIDLIRREQAQHVLVKRPQCPACGQNDRPAAAESKPVVLESRPRTAGVERTSSVAETYERYKHHVSPITGAVTYLRPSERTQHGPIYNHVAGHYRPALVENVTALRIALATCSGGKGRTPAKARTSALCEALERYSGVSWGDEPRIRDSYVALRPDAIHIRDLAQFSERQYATRRESAPVSERQTVHEPLPDDAVISWSPAWSLTQQRTRYLPTAYCYYGHRDPGLIFTACDSNGVAAGNSVEEAILYGLLELVERDSVALWWYHRLRRPAVDADSFGLPYWHEMKRYYDQELDRDLHALDLTADMGIPTFTVISRRRDRAVEDVLVGFGAHLDPSLALLRALDEVNQSLPAVREEAEDGSTIYRLLSAESVQWWKTATYANQPYLSPDPEAAPSRLEDFDRLASDDVRTDVETCQRALERAGLEVLVLDQTRPDIGLPVVRVVVPGMRHFWRRLGPGRLYDVPVKLGWLPSPTPEAELNPISCYL
jgi:bacteriocin biosynthesis cyclodehydratase domain-containing protein